MILLFWFQEKQFNATRCRQTVGTDWKFEENFPSKTLPHTTGKLSYLWGQIWPQKVKPFYKFEVKYLLFFISHIWLLRRKFTQTIKTFWCTCWEIVKNFVKKYYFHCFMLSKTTLLWSSWLEKWMCFTAIGVSNFCLIKFHVTQ